MKKVILALGILVALSCLMVILARGVLAVTYIQVGDANASGGIDMGDTVVVQRMILGLEPVKSYADANWSGTVDMGDVTYIIRIISGLSPVVHP